MKKKSKILVVSVCVALCLCTVAVAALGSDFLNLKSQKLATVATREAPNGESYDLSITTFNVGGFAAGIDCGITKDATNYGWSDALERWDDVISNNKFTSDIYGMQEFFDVFYKENGNPDATVYSADKFDSVFKQLQTFKIKTHNKLWDMSSAIASTKSSPYELKDITSGILSGKTSDPRVFVKGYVNIKGVDVAIFVVHPVSIYKDENNTQRQLNQIIELLDMMKKEDYAIALGDFNTSTVAKIAQSNGFATANMSSFGNFKTFINTSEDIFIDNIVVSPNIDIKYAECLCTDDNPDNDNRGYSDHFPLTAYLTIDETAGKATYPEIKTDDDGFVSTYH